MNINMKDSKVKGNVVSSFQKNHKIYTSLMLKKIWSTKLIMLKKNHGQTHVMSKAIDAFIVQNGVFII